MDLNVKIEPEDLISKIIKYGLYFGAIFQLCCILACIFYPSVNCDKTKSDFSDESGNESTNHSSQNTPSKVYKKKIRQEKKKRR